MAHSPAPDGNPGWQRWQVVLTVILILIAAIAGAVIGATGQG